jgi:hypothetical protein
MTKKDKDKKKKKRSGTKIWLDDDSYIYLKSGEYVRQKLASRKGCETYRMISPKSGRYILICRKKDGKWKAVSILRYVGIDLRTLKDKDEADDIKKARELIKEREKK